MRKEINLAAAELGRGIFRWRKVIRNLTQAELARAAGVTAACVSGIEGGRAGLSIDKTWKIAEALKVEPHILFNCDGSVPVIGRAEPGRWLKRPLFSRETIYPAVFNRLASDTMEAFELPDGSLVGGTPQAYRHDPDCRRIISQAGLWDGARCIVLRRDGDDYELALRNYVGDTSTFKASGRITQTRPQRFFFASPISGPGIETEVLSTDKSVCKVWLIQAEIRKVQTEAKK